MINPSQYGPLFLLAASLDGDLARTAVVAGVQGPELAELADALEWRPKLTLLQELKETEGPDAYAREVNRLVNYQQAVRCRDILNRAVEFFAEQEPQALLTQLTASGAASWTARVLVDLAKSIETVQGLTYRALGDTATERASTNSLGAARLATASKGLAAALDGPTAKLPSPARARVRTKKPRKRPDVKALPATHPRVAAALDLESDSGPLLEKPS